MRGFRQYCVGPRTPEGDSLGGDMYFAGGIHLLSPPLFKVVSQKIVTPYLHVFYNVGNLVQHNQSGNVLILVIDI